MRQSQTQRGKAFEYAVAAALSRALDAPLDDESALSAKVHYDVCDQRDSMDRAGLKAAVFLKTFDQSLNDAVLIQLQPGTAGQQGDVRDVLIRLQNGDIGISAKSQSDEIRSPRLSDTIDFGLAWAGYPVSDEYWRAICPVFDHLKKLREQGARFRDITNKSNTIYLPVLAAFEDEFRRLCEANGSHFIERVFRYIIGTHDFYKVVRRRDYVLIQSFNLRGTLGWGRRWSIPNRIELIQRRRGSTNTLLVSFEGGSQLSFRLHNATSRVEPSLKFSVKFVGLPHDTASNQIPISGP